MGSGCCTSAPFIHPSSSRPRQSQTPQICDFGIEDFIPTVETYYIDGSNSDCNHVYVISDAHIRLISPRELEHAKGRTQFEDNERRQRDRLRVIMDQIILDWEQPSCQCRCPVYLILLGDIYDDNAQPPEIEIEELKSLYFIMKQKGWFFDLLRDLKLRLNSQLTICYVRGNHDRSMKKEWIDDFFRLNNSLFGEVAPSTEDTQFVHFGGDRLLLFGGEGRNAVFEHGHVNDIYESRRFYSDAVLQRTCGNPIGYFLTRLATATGHLQFAGSHHFFLTLGANIFDMTFLERPRQWRNWAREILGKPGDEADEPALCEPSVLINHILDEPEHASHPHDGIAPDEDIEEISWFRMSDGSRLSLEELVFGADSLFPHDFLLNLMSEKTKTKTSVDVVGQHEMAVIPVDQEQEQEEEEEEEEGERWMVNATPTPSKGQRLRSRRQRRVGPQEFWKLVRDNPAPSWRTMLREGNQQRNSRGWGDDSGDDASDYSLIQKSCYSPFFGCWRLPAGVIDSLVIGQQCGMAHKLEHCPSSFAGWFSFVVYGHVHKISLETYDSNIGKDKLVCANAGRVQEWWEDANYVRLFLSSVGSHADVFTVEDEQEADINRRPELHTVLPRQITPTGKWHHGHPVPIPGSFGSPSSGGRHSSSETVFVFRLTDASHLMSEKLEHGPGQAASWVATLDQGEKTNPSSLFACAKHDLELMKRQRVTFLARPNEDGTTPKKGWYACPGHPFVGADLRTFFKEDVGRCTFHPTPLRNIVNRRFVWDQRGPRFV